MLVVIVRLMLVWIWMFFALWVLMLLCAFPEHHLCYNWWAVEFCWSICEVFCWRSCTCCWFCCAGLLWIFMPQLLLNCWFWRAVCATASAYRVQLSIFFFCVEFNCRCCLTWCLVCWGVVLLLIVAVLPTVLRSSAWRSCSCLLCICSHTDFLLLLSLSSCWSVAALRMGVSRFKLLSDCMVWVAVSWCCCFGDAHGLCLLFDSTSSGAAALYPGLLRVAVAEIPYDAWESSASCCSDLACMSYMDCYPLLDALLSSMLAESVPDLGWCIVEGLF